MPAAQNFGFRHSATGKTLYLTVRGETPSVDHFQLWNQALAAFEAQDNANWTATKYCCPLSENPASGYMYTLVFPSVTAGRVYMVDVYEQAGASPALSDTLVASFLGVMGASKFLILAADVQQWLGATAPANTGDAFARLGAPAGASIAADVATVDGVADAIKLKTDNLPASPAAVGSAMTLATDAISAAAISTAALNKLCKIMGVKTTVNAAGTELKVYDTSGALVATLTKSGTDPVVWESVFA